MCLGWCVLPTLSCRLTLLALPRGEQRTKRADTFAIPTGAHAVMPRWPGRVADAIEYGGLPVHRRIRYHAVLQFDSVRPDVKRRRWPRTRSRYVGAITPTGVSRPRREPPIAAGSPLEGALVALRTNLLRWVS